VISVVMCRVVQLNQEINEVMVIAVKLMGLLKSKNPPRGTIELRDGATIEEVLQGLQVETTPAFVISVNGQIERNRARTLVEGDQLTVIPPVGGG